MTPGHNLGCSTDTSNEESDPVSVAQNNTTILNQYSVRKHTTVAYPENGRPVFISGTTRLVLGCQLQKQSYHICC